MNLESQWNIFLAAKDSRFGLCYKCDSYFLHLRFKFNIYFNLTLFEVSRQWKIDVRSSINYRALDLDNQGPFIDVNCATEEEIFEGLESMRHRLCLRLVPKLILAI